MNCEVLSTLYFRSNGDIPCNDDAGEKIILARASETNWKLRGALRNPAYTHIDHSLEVGETPWPQTCPSCAFFRPNEPFSESIISRWEIRKLQIEPSLACNLRCPCCSQAQQIAERPKPFLMKAQLLETILGGIREAGYRVREVEFCGQGEPLMNRKFPAFVSLVRKYLPRTPQRLITNGNFNYLESTGGEPIDEIFVSCDGVRQSSYQRYRVFGKVDLALEFMRAIPKEIDNQRQFVVWKYILFEFNDSDEEIWEAQNVAQELKVDTLLFVHTHSKFRSQRYTVKNASEFPIYYANVKTNATPNHYQLGALPELPPALPAGQDLVRILS